VNETVTLCSASVPSATEAPESGEAMAMVALLPPLDPPHAVARSASKTYPPDILGMVPPPAG
jgi:hypothetical protein